MSQPAKPAVCLFAHYAPDRRLSASVLHYLTQLTHCGFAVHVALSGMDRLVPEDREILDRLGIAYCVSFLGIFNRYVHRTDFNPQYLVGVGLWRAE